MAGRACWSCPVAERLGPTDCRKERSEDQECASEAVRVAADDEECVYVSPDETIDR
ncbi:hypothetical protein ASPSYDRAFT_42064 [Aspergillus sydowii CBS 593.65]|uniref:Uncharacterized protein n=1 Tax=Aspergillus sydowii CBS 593.65 TaxID=1036612 RepID=A0A1L9TLS9_9EURO|nr:uncharacterized protein ASPSYDRAFT_42064 [Aspergillus sydowii CBS 593.65]OJJ60341.1 hypothetical protein ASPSYDRAFT_42064 [Aspergillus sydowii CBS 593.65]